MRRTLATALAGILLAAAQPAAACSVARDYRVPTNLELAERADAIMLAVVEDGPTDLDGMNGPEPRLAVRLIATLKGGPLPERMLLSGMIAPERFAVPSNPNELEQAHPLAYIGGCVRYMFVRGSTVLFFLQQREGRLGPVGYPFARDAEDVPSENSRWVQAVRFYVEVAALPLPERRAALLARQAALRARTNDADAQAIADDIDRQLRGPNRPWNAIMAEEVRRMEAEERPVELADPQ